jgi:hypothetical protein
MTEIIRKWKKAYSHPIDAEPYLNRESILRGY